MYCCDLSCCAFVFLKNGKNFHKMLKKLFSLANKKNWRRLLCILTSKQVLGMPVAGPNHLFLHFKSFFIKKNKMGKRGKTYKKVWKNAMKRGLPAFRCHSKALVDNPMLVDTWGNPQFNLYMSYNKLTKKVILSSSNYTR